MTNDIEKAEKNDLAEAWDALLSLADKVFDRRGQVNVAICRMSTLRPARQRLLRNFARPLGRQSRWASKSRAGWNASTPALSKRHLPMLGASTK